MIPTDPSLRPLAERLAESLEKVYSRSRSYAPAVASPPSCAEHHPEGVRHLRGHLAYGSYGPSKNQPLYRDNAKPEMGRIFRTQKRLELIARMENAGIPESQMAQMLCISLPRLRQLKRSKDYLKARVKITLGLIIDQDLALAETREQRREVLTSLLPPALQVIANAVQRPPSCFAEHKLQVEVAQDILDREGTYAKISRSEVRPVEHFNWDAGGEAAREIVQIISQNQDPAMSYTGDVSIRAAQLIEITKAFSTSGTITPEEQQSALRTVEAEGAAALAEHGEDEAAPPEGWAKR